MGRVLNELKEHHIKQLAIEFEILLAEVQYTLSVVDIDNPQASHHCRAHSTGRDPKYLFSGLLVCGVRGAVRHLRPDAVRLQPGAHVGRQSARTRSGSHARSWKPCWPRSSATCSPRKAWTCSSRKWRGCSRSTDGRGSRTWRRPPRGSRSSSRRSRISWRRSSGHFHAEHQGGAGRRGGRADAVAPDGAAQGPRSGGDVPAEHGGAVQAGGRGPGHRDATPGGQGARYSAGPRGRPFRSIPRRTARSAT